MRRINSSSPWMLATSVSLSHPMRCSTRVRANSAWSTFVRQCYWRAWTRRTKAIIIKLNLRRTLALSVSTSMLYEFLSDSDFPDMSPSGQVHRDPSPSCLFADQRFDKKCPNWTRNEGWNRNRSQEVVRRSIAAVEGAGKCWRSIGEDWSNPLAEIHIIWSISDVSAFVRLQFPMYSQFANGMGVDNCFFISPPMDLF